MLSAHFPPRFTLLAHPQLHPLAFSLLFYPPFYIRGKGHWWAWFPWSCNHRCPQYELFRWFCNCCLSRIHKMKWQLDHLLCILYLRKFAICLPKWKDDLSAKGFQGPCRNQCGVQFWRFRFFRRDRCQTFQDRRVCGCHQLRIKIFFWISFWFFWVVCFPWKSRGVWVLPEQEEIHAISRGTGTQMFPFKILNLHQWQEQQYQRLWQGQSWSKCHWDIQRLWFAVFCWPLRWWFHWLSQFCT